MKTNTNNLNNSSSNEQEFSTLPERLELLARTANITNDQLMTVLLNMDNTVNELKWTMAEMGDMETDYDSNPIDIQSDALLSPAKRAELILETVQLAQADLPAPFDVDPDLELDDVVRTTSGDMGTIIGKPVLSGGCYTIITFDAKIMMVPAEKLTYKGFKLFVEVSK